MRKRLFLLTLIMAFLLIPISVSAEEKSYTVTNLDIDVELTKDGNAKITEVWNLKLESGEFERFQKDIYRANNELEKFTDFQLYNLQMNGQLVDQLYSESNNKNTYAYTKNENNVNIKIFYPTSAPNTVSYSFRYELFDVVKGYNENAYFCYRYVGKKFDDPINNINIKINTPKNIPFEIESFESKSEISYDNNCIRINNTTGLQKICIKMDKIGFIGLEEISSLDTSNEDEEYYTNGQKIGFSQIFHLCIPFIVFIGIIIYLKIFIAGGNGPGGRGGGSGYNDSGWSSGCSSCSSCSGCGGGCGGCGGD